jgi:dTDP-glucose 4,6-dehydratase
MPQTLRDVRTLVTGGAGFIGSTVVAELCKLGAEVTVLDDFSFGDLQNVKDHDIRIMCGDLREEEAVFKAVKDQEVIFHLAARPFIPLCYERPKEFFEVNSLGTLNLMLAAIKEEPEFIVNVSSSEVYGSAQYVPMDEEHPTNPHSTYAVSKLAADRICFTLHMEHSLPVCLIRPFNTYGPRETHPYIIPEVISQFARSNTINCGNLETTRDFTFIEDTVRALILAGRRKEAIGKVINIGSGNEIKMRDLVVLIAELMEVKDLKIVQNKTKIRPFDVTRLLADNTKAKEILGWEPKINLEEGLKKTVDWYLKNGRQWPYERNPFYAEYFKT